MAENSMNPDSTSAKQDTVALLIASGKTVRDAAAEAGAGERTVYTWLSDSQAFRDRVRELRHRMHDEAAGRLAAVAGRSIEVLAELLAPDKPDGLKLAAAKVLLSATPRLVETHDLSEQLQELQRRLDQRDGRRPGSGTASTEASAHAIQTSTIGQESPGPAAPETPESPTASLEPSESADDKSIDQGAPDALAEAPKAHSTIPVAQPPAPTPTPYNPWLR